MQNRRRVSGRGFHRVPHRRTGGQFEGSKGFRFDAYSRSAGGRSQNAAHRQVRQSFVEAGPREPAIRRTPDPVIVGYYYPVAQPGGDCDIVQSAAHHRRTLEAGQVGPRAAAVVGPIELLAQGKGSARIGGQRDRARTGFGQPGNHGRSGRRRLGGRDGQGPGFQVGGAKNLSRAGFRVQRRAIGAVPHARDCAGGRARQIERYAGAAHLAPFDRLLRVGDAAVPRKHGGDQHWYGGCSFMTHGRFHSTLHYRLTALLT
jgi:hypothetical protein